MTFCTNISSLPWPFNPAGHYMDLQGKNNHSLISNTALVYTYDGLPKPWPYVFVFALLSFGFALFGTISAWSFSKSKKESVLTRVRKPFIKFGVFRTIMMVVQIARIAHTHRIPSSISTVSNALSLISNFLDWEDRFDNHSWAVLVCTAVLFGLLPVQLDRNIKVSRDNNGLISGADGYGTTTLFGGTCVRTLQKDESCSALKDLACTPGPLTNLASIKGTIGEMVAIFLGLVCIPLCFGYMVVYVYRHVLPNILLVIPNIFLAKRNILPVKGHIVPTDSDNPLVNGDNPLVNGDNPLVNGDNPLVNGDNLPANSDNLPANANMDGGALRALMKFCVLIMNVLMFIAVGLLTWNPHVKYVGVTEMANGIRISECFASDEPKDSADFLMLWFNQPRSPADFLALITGT